MDDDAGAQAPQLLWINWTDQVVSFHSEEGLIRWRSPTTTPCWHMCSRRPPTAFASSERPLGENRLQGVTHEIYH